MQIQQGDVLLQKVDVDVKNLKKVKRKNGCIVLAEGESTGHAHRIVDVDAMFYEKDGDFYLVNNKTVTVTHEEHKPITVDPGTWKVWRVREKDWLSGMVYPVAD